MIRGRRTAVPVSGAGAEAAAGLGAGTVAGRHPNASNAATTVGASLIE
jgi:hypothetical protein